MQIKFSHITKENQRVYHAATIEIANAFTRAFGVHGAFTCPCNMFDDNKRTGYYVLLCK